MTSKEIRQSYLQFFESQGHIIYPSDSIVIKNDPTLMFTNAGMNQFKNVFLGNTDPKDVRVVNTQRCLRVSGKHNDLEEVGYDNYHHTMFEMLGNWSLGDYFKEEAIRLAWIWLTEDLQIDKDRLFVTYFSGDEADKVEIDLETKNLWKKYLPEERILPFGKKDNFWEMGSIGPCGPCSEIHYDNRSDEEKAKVPATQLVNGNNEDVIEIWNLVFIQYQRLANGSLQLLSNKFVDTGMGLERIVRVKNHLNSNYDTDIFQVYISEIENIVNRKYASTKAKEDVAMRVLADHIRTIVLAIADGQMFSNVGAGYVIRRVLRRAVRYYYSFLDYSEPLLYQLVPICFEQFKEVFPEIMKDHSIVQKNILTEEKNFLSTISQGLNRMEKIIANSQSRTIHGKEIFKLYDTYGFPYDLSELIAKEKGYDINQNQFSEELSKQKVRSKEQQDKHMGDWNIIHDDSPKFVGYETLRVETNLLKYRVVKLNAKKIFQFVLSQNPFYSKGGGQEGDCGKLLFKDGKDITIFDTITENGLGLLHANYSKEIEEKITSTQGEVNAIVDKSKRHNTAIHHTATHLLNAALRKVLGDGVLQKGSFLDDNMLRFDFNHSEQLSAKQIQDIESIVNGAVRMNYEVEISSATKEEGMQRATTHAFDEKYADIVRLVSIDEANRLSVELCGGTHVKHTGEIGFFKIIKEASIASGIRRITAVSGKKAEEYIHQKMDMLTNINAILKHPKDISLAIEKELLTSKQKSSKIKGLTQYLIKSLVKDVQKNVREIHKVTACYQYLEELDFAIAQDLAREMCIHQSICDIACIGVKKDPQKYQFIVMKNKTIDVNCIDFLNKDILSNKENQGGGNANQGIFISSHHFDEAIFVQSLTQYLTQLS